MTDLFSSQQSDEDFAPIAPEYKYGGFSRRSYAFSFDSILGSVLFTILYYVWDYFYPVNLDIMTTDVFVILSFVEDMFYYCMIFMVLYGAIFECMPGIESSPGKYLLGLKVINSEGERIGFIRALWRNILKMISSLVLLPFLVAAFHPYKRSLHDILAGTYVVFA